MPSVSIERVLFTEEEIDRRIRQVAAEISADYAGRELKLVGVLKGSVFFLTALARELTVPVTGGFSGHIELRQSEGRAGDGADREGPGRQHRRRGRAAGGRYHRHRVHHALPAAAFVGARPKSLAVCTLLDRTPRRIVQIPVDYRCFEIPGPVCGGFGLDYQQLYRNLKYVAVLNPERGTE
jgi:hypoxanthine phosphoribosyltransferase